MPVEANPAPSPFTAVRDGVRTRHWAVSRSSIPLVSGITSRVKTLTIAGDQAPLLRTMLATLQTPAASSGRQAGGRLDA